MIRGILLLITIMMAMASGATAALAKRVALVIGNSAYQNVSRLDNPRNDAALIAKTLQGLGFSLIGQGALFDLDKANLDLAIQQFGNSLQGAEVGMFYFAGHGVQVRGANYLVPVNANPTREADVDFQMVDVGVVLRQMEAAGIKLNLVLLDACRNNPFGGRGLRASEGGLAQMRAPEGTLISFATQPGNVALDGADGNSPYTKALAKTIGRSGLDIFRVFNEVGLEVKRSTGGSQQPWVSSSPIDGNFYFAAPSVENVPAPAADNAAQAWAATRDTTSVAVIETFIQQYGDSIYAPFARARRDELKNSQVAIVAPSSAPAETRPSYPRLAKADVAKLFEPFNQSIAHIRKSYIFPRDEKELFSVAVTAMQRAYPAVNQVSGVGSPVIRPANSGIDTEAVYAAALTTLNRQSSGSEDARIAQVAIRGVLASLDPHSSYMDANEFRNMQTQSRGSFGGLGLEVTMENGLLKVVSPIDGTPASMAGVLPNDLIARIDDAPVHGLTLNQAVEKMRGPVNTKVKLTIIRQKQDVPLEITIVRDTIKIRSVRWRVEGNDVGYIRITAFTDQTLTSLKQAFDDIAAKAASNNLRGYILDLRNNPGGLMNEAIAVADAFLDRGEIVSTQGRNPIDAQRFTAKPGDLSKGKQVVVLINGGSASGSEILAGALQDNKRAKVVGTRSFGKGTIQSIFPMGAENGALRLSTAHYLTPLGRSIEARGITPDLEVLQDEPEEIRKSPTSTAHTKGSQQVGLQSYIPLETQNDKALTKALELMRASKPAGQAKRYKP